MEDALSRLNQIYAKPCNEEFARHKLKSRGISDQTSQSIIQTLENISKECPFKAVFAEEYINLYIRDASIKLSKSLVNLKLFNSSTKLPRKPRMLRNNRLTPRPLSSTSKREQLERRTEFDNVIPISRRSYQQCHYVQSNQFNTAALNDSWSTEHFMDESASPRWNLRQGHYESCVYMASSTFKHSLTHSCTADVTYHGIRHNNVRFMILPNLCVKVIFGHPWTNATGSGQNKALTDLKQSQNEKELKSIIGMFAHYSKLNDSTDNICLPDDIYDQLRRHNTNQTMRTNIMPYPDARRPQIPREEAIDNANRHVTSMSTWSGDNDMWYYLT
ncbi:hypothetical protein GJ496_011540 [Pomphorhynchus laevis]|nr:hypothetical protein GJ496_011540 [Pomphorhynchus laevis]